MARKVKHTRSKDPKAKAALAFSKAQRGLDRAAHFAEGKDLASWRGIKTVERDRKREKSRRACRGPVRF